ncbi:hypothetical protein DdX_06638 [Ditylenchus destructor]|uniref:Uncharacterized protein n=1 Tax=Ditylenchus destructor TaxID=166010 RepID=A0AAD4R5W9_9BILA|nr:hypothetical protein DdX_06638 [Ditylenchus destructor]
MYFTNLLFLSLSTIIKLPRIHCALEDDIKTLSNEQKNALYLLIESKIGFSPTKNKGQYGYSHTLISQSKARKPLSIALDHINETHAKTHCNEEYNTKKTSTFCLEPSKPKAKPGDKDVRDHNHLMCYVARVYFNYQLAKLAQLLFPENVDSHINRIPRAIENFVKKETKEFNKLWRAQQESSVNLNELLKVLNSKVEEDVEIDQEIGDSEIRCLGSITDIPPPKNSLREVLQRLNIPKEDKEKTTAVKKQLRELWTAASPSGQLKGRTEVECHFIKPTIEFDGELYEKSDLCERNMVLPLIFRRDS